MRLPDGGTRAGSGSGAPSPATGITPEGRGFRVTCAGGCSWPLDRRVNTTAHATNLLQKHIREHHADDPAVQGEPPSVDLTAAARYLLTLQDDQDLNAAAGAAYFAALDLWQALTGLEGRVALAYAHTVSTRATVAVLPPF